MNAPRPSEHTIPLLGVGKRGAYYLVRGDLPSKHQIQPESMEMSRLTRDRTAEPVSRDQMLRRERGQGNIYFTYCCQSFLEQVPSTFVSGRLSAPLCFPFNATPLIQYVLHHLSKTLSPPLWRGCINIVNDEEIDNVKHTTNSVQSR